MKLFYQCSQFTDEMSMVGNRKICILNSLNINDKDNKTNRQMEKDRTTKTDKQNRERERLDKQTDRLRQTVVHGQTHRMLKRQTNIQRQRQR